MDKKTEKIGYAFCGFSRIYPVQKKDGGFTTPGGNDVSIDKIFDTPEQAREDLIVIYERWIAGVADSDNPNDQYCWKQFSDTLEKVKKAEVFEV